LRDRHEGDTTWTVIGEWRPCCVLCPTKRSRIKTFLCNRVGQSTGPRSSSDNQFSNRATVPKPPSAQILSTPREYARNRRYRGHQETLGENIHCGNFKIDETNARPVMLQSAYALLGPYPNSRRTIRQGRALPAVSVPLPLVRSNAGLSLPSFSSDVSRRGKWSVETPSSGTMRSEKNPRSCAATALR
jgi:hypothetical protein